MAKPGQADQVLEIDCNHGRTRLGRLQSLRSPGGYCGFDIQDRQVDYARRHVGSAACEIDFRYAPVHNAHHNPGGTIDAAEHVFDYDDGRLDVCHAASVFTRMLTRPTANYFRQVERLLKAGGRALFSMLLLDHFRGTGTSSDGAYEFVHTMPDEPGLAIADPELPEAYTDYDLKTLGGYAAAGGMRIAEVVPGTWSGRFDRGVCEQDLVVFEKGG